jgi:hypothetical protein
MRTQPPRIPTELSSVRLKRLGRLEDLEWMAETGETVPGAALRLHVHPQTVRDFLYRAGRRDLLARLLANQDDRQYAGPRASIRRTA